MTLRYRVIQWLARIALALAAIVALALFLGYAPVWAAVVLLMLGGGLVAIVLHRIET